VAVGRRTARKRAVGTRERIIAYLTEAGSLSDVNGMASTQLAAAVGYPGSSVAFAQLLSGMERSGLIEREVRGKRTYRIGLGPAQAGGTMQAAEMGPAFGGVGAAGVAGAARAIGAGVATGADGAAAGADGVRAGAGGVAAAGAGGVAAGSGTGADGFDYDELARRLLVQVVRRLAAADPAPPDRPAPADQSALQQTVTGLEYELATAWSKHGKLAEENARLREQLSAAQRSLAQAAEQVRRLPASTDLDSSEVVLLQRLLTSGGSDGANGAGGSDGQGGSDRADDSGQDGLAETPSLLG